MLQVRTISPVFFPQLIKFSWVEIGQDLTVMAFFAAIETTLWSMEWAIAELVNHPNVQSKLRDEISTILEGSPLTESDLHRLPYLQAVVKETLRLHTPIPLLVPHMNLEEAKLNGYTIPEGSKVVVNAWWLANNPEWWRSRKSSGQSDSWRRKMAQMPLSVEKSTLSTSHLG